MNVKIGGDGGLDEEAASLRANAFLERCAIGLAGTRYFFFLSLF